MDSKPVLQLKGSLQKFIKFLVAVRPKLEELEKSHKRDVASLANLLEQWECIHRVETSETTLAVQFPDVKARVLVKLSAEIDTKVELLSHHIDEMQKHHEAAYKALNAAVNLCRKQSFDLDTLNKGEPTVPPLMAMLDMVADVERRLREIVGIRRHYLDNITDKSIVNSDKLVSVWSEDIPALLVAIKDCEEQTQYFLEEKL